MTFSRVLSFLLAAVATSTALAQSAVDVSILSIDMFNVDARRIEKPSPITVPGRLVLPPGSGPFPALIVVNSSAGTDDRIWDRLLADLPAHGFAALGLQTFAGRGIRGGVDSRQGAISFLAAPTDALFALKFLRGRPEIDATRICVIGHSRGGQAAFNFLYFYTFLQLVGLQDEPFACNISINTGGHYRPENLQATGRPALVFIGEKDDVWHMDIYRSFVEQVRDAGNPVEIFTLKDSYHSLTSEREYCPGAMNARDCREQVQYSEAGLRIGGRTITNKEGWSKCGDWGYHCGYGSMDKYPDMLAKTVEFLRRAIPERPRKQ